MTFISRLHNVYRLPTIEKQCCGWSADLLSTCWHDGEDMRSYGAAVPAARDHWMTTVFAVELDWTYCGGLQHYSAVTTLTERRWTTVEQWTPRGSPCIRRFQSLFIIHHCTDACMRAFEWVWISTRHTVQHHSPACGHSAPSNPVELTLAAPDVHYADNSNAGRRSPLTNDFVGVRKSFARCVFDSAIHSIHSALSGRRLRPAQCAGNKPRTPPLRTRSFINCGNQWKLSAQISRGHSLISASHCVH